MKENPKNVYVVLFATVLPFFMTLLGSSSITVIGPYIAETFKTPLPYITWATTGYLIAYTVPLLLTGRMGDRYGAKNMYVFGTILFALASFASAFSPNIFFLIVTRVFQGLGAAVLAPQSFRIITILFEPKKRALANSAWAIASGISALFGPLLSGLITTHFGWQAVFFIPVPIAAASLAVIVKFVPSTAKKAVNIKSLDALVSAVGIFLLAFGIQQGEGHSWGQIYGIISVPLCIVLGLAILAFFFYRQSKLEQDDALVPLSVLKNKNLMLACLIVFFIAFVGRTMNTPVVYWVECVQRWTATEAAVLFIPSAIVSTLLAPIIGRALIKHEPKNMLLIGLSLNVIALSIVYMIMTRNANGYYVLIPALMLGLATAFIENPLFSVATFDIEEDDSGAGAGVYNASYQLGMVLSTSVLSALMQTLITKNNPPGESMGGATTIVGRESIPERLYPYFSNAMGQSVICVALIILITIVCALFIKRRGRSVGHADPAGSGGAGRESSGAELESGCEAANVEAGSGEIGSGV